MSPPPRPPIICYDLPDGPRTRRKVLNSIVRPSNTQRRRTQPVIYKSYVAPTVTFSSMPTVDRTPITRSYMTNKTPITAQPRTIRNPIARTPLKSPFKAPAKTPTKTPAKTPAKIPTKSPPKSPPKSSPKVSSKSHSLSNSLTNSPVKSFHLDEETLEVTDMNFFDKIEDQTMLEMNRMMNRLGSTLKALNNL